MFRYTNHGQICKCLISTWKEYIFPKSWIQDLTCVHHSKSVGLLFCLIHLALWWQDSKLTLAIVSIFASDVLGLCNQMHTNQIQKKRCESDTDTVYSREGTKQFNEENIRNKTNQNDP